MLFDNRQKRCASHPRLFCREASYALSETLLAFKLGLTPAIRNPFYSYVFGKKMLQDIVSVSHAWPPALCRLAKSQTCAPPS